MKIILKIIILLFLLTNQASSDTRLRDPKIHYVAMLEHNVVLRRQNNKIVVTYDQIIAYNYTDVNKDGILDLYPIDYIIYKDVESIDSNHGGVIVRTRSGDIVMSRLGYDSLTDYDPEQCGRARFGVGRVVIFNTP